MSDALHLPLDSLPGVVGTFVAESAAAIGCDPAMVALPTLAALAASIGNVFAIAPKPDFSAPAVLWCAVVGESASHKSPAAAAALAPLRSLQDARHAEYRAQAREHAERAKRHRAEMRAWEREAIGDPPTEPEAPRAVRYMVDDATLEALALILADNPRGVLQERDELAGWIAAQDKYRGGRGDDGARWLSLFDAAPLTIDRKGGDRRTLYVPRAAVSVTGGIQPGTLERVFGERLRENGMLARFLFAWPESRPMRWSDRCVSAELIARMRMVYDNILSVTPRLDEYGNVTPVRLTLHPDALAHWTGWFDNFREGHVETRTGHLRAALGKLPGYSLRLALVLHVATWAAAGAHGDGPGPVTLDAIRGGTSLAMYFTGQAERVYGWLERDADEPENMEAIIRRMGGEATVNELTHGPRRWRGKPDRVRAELDALGAQGRGEWRERLPGPRGGCPTRVFRLFGAGPGTETPTCSGPAGGLGSSTGGPLIHNNGERIGDRW